MIRAPVIRMIGLALMTAVPAFAPAQEAGWAGGYGGLALGTGEPGASLFVGAMAERGPAVLGLELGAGLGEGDLALTGRLGGGLGGTLLYGLAGVGAGEGEGVELGAGASRRLGGLRVGGELRRGVGSGPHGGDTRLGGRIALEF